MGNPAWGHGYNKGSADGFSKGFQKGSREGTGWGVLIGVGLSATGFVVRWGIGNLQERAEAKHQQSLPDEGPEGDAGTPGVPTAG